MIYNSQPNIESYESPDKTCKLSGQILKQLTNTKADSNLLLLPNLTVVANTAQKPNIRIDRLSVNPVMPYSNIGVNTRSNSFKTKQ